MAEKKSEFTVYLEGHDGHRGNVLAHAFIAKLQRLVIVLGRLERAYLSASTRRTDFEITDASKTNPTALSLKPVPRTVEYNPTPAFEWSMAQLRIVGEGGVPDERVRGEIASDLVRLSTKEADADYKAFWINGYAEAVRFDEEYLARAQKIARDRAKEDAPNRWHTGTSLGSIVGELKKIDDMEGNQEFVIVPRTGPESVVCRFPESLRDEIGRYIFKTVRVRGALHYGEDSPFPYRLDADANGIEEFPREVRRRTLSELRGVFADREKPNPDWDTLLNG